MEMLVIMLPQRHIINQPLFYILSRWAMNTHCGFHSMYGFQESIIYLNLHV